MTSFDPKDFGTPRWKGGKATITNPRFEYRSFTPEKGEFAGQEVRVVIAKLDLIDTEGNPQKAQYDVGNARYCQIKAGPEAGADIANVGPSIANPDPLVKYTVYPDSDFGLLVKSLVAGGFPAAKLGEGDIRVLDGVEADFYDHSKKDGDKFPLRLVKPGTIKLAAGSTRNETVTVDVNAVKKAATSSIVAAMNGGTISAADAVRRIMADLKGQDIRPHAIKLVSDESFVLNSDAWLYDAESKTFTAV